MIGGLAVRGNLLVVTWSAGRGHVLLFDLAAGERVGAFATPVGASGFSDAAGVAIGPDLRLYVADPHNDCVLVCSAFGRRLAALGSAPPATGDRGRDRNGVLDHPHAVAIRGDRVYVAAGDRPRRHGVQCFGVDGRVLRPLAARGDPEQAFAAPRGLWADGQGLLVADTLRGVVQVFAANDTFVHEVAVAVPGTVARPVAVLRLANRELLVVDRGDRPGLVVLAPDGRHLPHAASLGAECRDPIALARDERGRVYVLDHDGERVFVATPGLAFDRVVVDLREHVPDWQ